MPRDEAKAVAGSFLTAAQRASLDAALAEKAAESAARAKELQAQQKALAGKARGAAGGAREPKKGGGGGKFTWGSIMTDASASVAMDRNDPNYDSDEERTVVLTHHERLKSELQIYKEKVEAVVAQYLLSGDLGDAAESLQDLGAPGYMHYFVKRLITTALDRSNKEREMASVALSGLYADVIPPGQVLKGFTNLADSIDDLVLDVPEAPELLAVFIARAVVDDVLPPAVAGRLPDTPGPAKALKQKLEHLLGARHGSEKVLRCWAPAGTGLATYEGTKDSIARLLAEFASSRDTEEAARCLRGLSMPFFHHEVAKQAVVAAMEAVHTNPGLAQALVGLLARLAQTGEVSPGQMSKGLGRVAAQLDDMCLDNPQAREQHGRVMELVLGSGVLDDDDAARPALMHVRGSLSGASVMSVAGTEAAGPQPHSLGAFKAESLSIIKEYFDSSDAAEVGRRLQELQDPGLLHVFVKQAIVASLDRKDRERELVSLLLSRLHPEVLSADQVAAGFTRLLAFTDDLVLDCPDAVHLLALFLGRAVVDEVMPPAMLTQVLRALPSQSLGVSVVKAAGAMLSARHGAERLSAAWHGGMHTLEQVRTQIRTLLDEYNTNRDVNEVARCLGDLGVRFFHHEVVKAAIELAFAQEKAEDPITKLLGALAAANVITETQMAKGFKRVRDALEEEALDYGPCARSMFARLQQAGVAQGWLPAVGTDA